MGTVNTPQPESGVATIVIGDGKRNNALTLTGWHRIADQVRAAGEAPQTRAIVLTGYGHTFSAGSDLFEWENADKGTVERCFMAMENCFSLIERVDVPVLASIEGAALGAGCQLALACDLALMADSAVIGMPIARLGILASPAFAARVSAKTGTAIAADLYLTGRSLPADEAHTRGLVARVVPDGTTYETAHRLATQIASLPTSSIVAAKQALLAVSRPDLEAPTLRPVPSVAIRDFHAAVTAFVHRHSGAKV